MRKITEKAVNKFFNMENFSCKNTKVFHTPGQVEMLLHWNLIVRYHIKGSVIELFDWGRQSRTTKERLNWILSKRWLGKIYQKWYNRYYEDENWHTRPFGNGIARFF